MNPEFFRLPVDFSPERLLSDLRICERETWIAHFNNRDYQGGWTSIALRSASGSNQDITSFPDQSFQDTPLMSGCAYFQEVVSWFECEKESIRLLCLAPMSQIKEHRDNDTSYEDGFFRIHIPVLTNEKVQFMVNRQLIPMRIGECWYADFQLPHSVHNNSEDPRVHLVIDCIRNGWSDTLFSAYGFEMTDQNKNKDMSRQTKLRVIEELMLSGSEPARLLAEELRKELVRHNDGE